MRTMAGTTLQDVRLELTKEEAEEKKAAEKAKAAERERRRGNAGEANQVDEGDHVQSLSSFMIQGLEIEEQQ